MSTGRWFRRAKRRRRWSWERHRGLRNALLVAGFSAFTYLLLTRVVLRVIS